jgi:hypothetical protein
MIALDPIQKKQVFLGLSAAIGGFIAVLSDIMQKGEASAVEQLANVLKIPSYMWAAALLLIALSVALSFIYGAESNKKAFTTGAGILAIMVTVTPYNALPNLNTTPFSNAEPSTTKDVGWLDRLMIPDHVLAQTPVSSPAVGPYTAELQPSDRKPIGIALFLLIDPASGQAVRRSRVQGNELKFYVNNTAYRLRVQVDGYQITEVNLPASPGTFSVPLTPSSIPVSLQRLYR